MISNDELGVPKTASAAERKRALDRRYYHKYKARKLAAAKVYRTTNKEKMLAGKRAYYATHKEKYAAYQLVYKERQRAWGKSRYQQYRDKADHFKRSTGCVDCGETDPVVLDFDHKDPATKQFNIGAHGASYGWARTLEEIAKCDVRCANCHRRRHANETHE